MVKGVVQLVDTGDVESQRGVVPIETVSIAEALASHDFEDDSLQTGEDEQQPLLPNDESSLVKVIPCKRE